MAYWLMKSEPNVYSIDDLEREKTTIWDGVRNYQARNYLQQMQVGDIAFFYHSNCKSPSIVGLMMIIEANLPDPTQFDPKSSYFDPKATVEHPRWFTARVQYQEKFSREISLTTLKTKFSGDELLIVRKGNRLSVIPVAEEIAHKIRLL